MTIRWQKLSGNGDNANAVAVSELTDMGGGPVFYDCLVQVEKVS